MADLFTVVFWKNAAERGIKSFIQGLAVGGGLERWRHHRAKTVFVFVFFGMVATAGRTYGVSHFEHMSMRSMRR